MNEYPTALHFTKHKLVIKVDENRHTDRDEKKENEREKKIKEELGFEFITINPDKENFDIFIEIGKTHSRIVKLTEKLAGRLTKESTKK